MNLIGATWGAEFSLGAVATPAPLELPLQC